MKRFVPEGVAAGDPAVTEWLRSAGTLTAAMEREEVLEAPVTLCDGEHNLHVQLPCMKGIIPREEGAVGMRDGTVKDIALISRVGKSVCFTVESVGYDEHGEAVAYLSRRHAQQLCKERYVASLHIGDVIPVRVTRLETFGAFCDIGCGLVALLPIACMSVSRISHPRDRVSVGDTLRCVVTSLEEGRICLSMRELLGTWEQNAARFAVGETVVGVIRSVESYGVFVELAPNLAGLAEPFEGAAAGQSAAVFIKSIIPDKMKIKLCIIHTAQTPVAPPPLHFFEKGSHVSCWNYATESSGRCIESVFTA